jgi:tetratricopeptide (TPR) repeat protein
MNPPADLFAEGWQHHQAGDLRRAEDIYRRILRTDPRNGKVWFVLGNLCDTDHRLEEAAAYMRQALELVPREAMGWFHLGNVLLKLEKYAEAEAAYRRCIEIQPSHVEALVNLGFAYGELERLDEARACYQRAMQFRPDYAEIHHNLGNLYRDEGKLDDALACYRRALELRPDYAKAHVNLGVALVARGDVDAAVRSLRRGVELEPDFAEAQNSLGTAFSVQGNLERAIAQYERAIALKADYPDAHWNRSLAWLLQGDFARGWADYEWRWRCKHTTPLPSFTQPRWDGSPLHGRTVLLYGEQGLGDTLQFIRYAPLVAARGGRVIVQCQDCLLPLLSRCATIDQFLGWSASPPVFDVWAPLLSLPHLLGTTLETVPAAVPYLFPDPNLVAHWRRELAPVRGFRVGIAWQGSPRHAWDRHRSVPLALFESLAEIEGVRLVSLQQNHGTDQVQALVGRFPLVALGELVDKTAGSFMDTAAVATQLDLVVSIDSAIGHLAGGLGVPTWLALHYTPDYRWLLHREDSPWYPTVRLFRQTAPGDWRAVFARIAEALRELVVRSNQSRPVLIEVSPGELVDKITILQIKSERISDLAKLENIRAELASLESVYHEALPPSPRLDELTAQLKSINEQLWQTEDDIRLCERAGDFGERFVELARSVYRMNDRRSALKRAINEFLRARVVEEKAYPGYENKQTVAERGNKPQPGC